MDRMTFGVVFIHVARSPCAAVQQAAEGANDLRPKMIVSAAARSRPVNSSSSFESSMMKSRSFCGPAMKPSMVMSLKTISDLIHSPRFLELADFGLLP